jgi:hypothetical protein
MKTYLYCITRSDLPVDQQAIQAAHAGIEYAYRCGRPEDFHSSLVFLVVPNQENLESLSKQLLTQGHPVSFFHENYKDWGLTAISVLLTKEDRHILKHLPLWRSK